MLTNVVVMSVMTAGSEILSLPVRTGTITKRPICRFLGHFGGLYNCCLVDTNYGAEYVRDEGEVGVVVAVAVEHALVGFEEGEKKISFDFFN